MFISLLIISDLNYSFCCLAATMKSLRLLKKSRDELP